MDSSWKTIWKSVFHPFDCAEAICQYQKDIERLKLEIKRCERDMHRLRIITLLANDHGWNGVDNPKDLAFFLRDCLDELEERRKTEGEVNTSLGIIDICMIPPLMSNLHGELAELQQENGDLKDINMRLHEKINLLTPEGLREKEPVFPTSYRVG